MKRIVIIDDEPHIIKTLKCYLEDNPKVEVVATATDKDTAKAVIDEYKPDILFIDVELGNDILSFEILNEIPYKEYKIVFVTAHEKYALKAIKFAAFDYLLKPILPDEIDEVIDKLIAEFDIENSIEQRLSVLEANMNADKPKRIVLNTSEKIVIVNPDDIIRMTADNAYTCVYCVSGKKTLVSKPIKYFDELLPSSIFFRVHRSHIINIEKVKEYIKVDGGEIIMKNGDIVPLSQSKKDDFLAHLS